MGIDKPRDGAPGTTDQSPRWEGPEETRPAATFQPRTTRTVRVTPPARRTRTRNAAAPPTP